MADISILDYLVFAATLAISVLIGVYYGFIEKQRTNNDLLMGGRNMSVFPVSLSLLATYVSATIILGWTGEIYANGSIIGEIILVALVYIPLAGALFLPTLYNLKLTSAYEYLELRFESRVVRLIATITFTVQIIIYMGVVLYAPSLGLNAVLDVPVYATILVVGTSAAIYTAIGGYKAVVWTDVFQMGMMFAGLLAVLIQGTIKMGGFENVFNIAAKHGRIQFLNFSLDPFMRHTSLSLFFGQGAMWLSGYGCHQPTVQRYCSMSSYKKALLSMLITSPLVALAMLLTVLSGIVVFANYAGCDPLTLEFIKKKDQIVPYFVVENLSETPGLVGLFLAALFSGSLSTVSSGVNSLAAVTWEDILKKHRYFEFMDVNRQGFVVKIIGFTYGMLTVGMAFFAGNFSGILAAALVVFGSASGPLLGVFILGIFIPFANKYGAGIGMLTGQVITFFISIGGLFLDKGAHRTLDFSIDECSDEILMSVNLTAILIKKNAVLPIPDLEWPEKIFSVSYLLYTLIGASLTIIVGIIVSLFTGRTKLTRELEPYIHPLLVFLHHKLGKNSRKKRNGNGVMLSDQSRYIIDSKSPIISNSADMNENTSF